MLRDPSPDAPNPQRTKTSKPIRRVQKQKSPPIQEATYVVIHTPRERTLQYRTTAKAKLTPQLTGDKCVTVSCREFPVFAGSRSGPSEVHPPVRAISYHSNGVVDVYWLRVVMLAVERRRLVQMQT